MSEKTVKRKRDDLKRLKVLDWRRRKQRSCLYHFPLEEEPIERLIPVLNTLKRRDGKSMIEGWFSRINGTQEGSPGPFLNQNPISSSRKGPCVPQERVPVTLQGGHQDPPNKKKEQEEKNKKKESSPTLPLPKGGGYGDSSAVETLDDDIRPLDERRRALDMQKEYATHLEEQGAEPRDFTQQERVYTVLREAPQVIYDAARLIARKIDNGNDFHLWELDEMLESWQANNREAPEA